MYAFSLSPCDKHYTFVYMITDLLSNISSELENSQMQSWWLKPQWVSAEKVFFSHTCFKQIYLSTKIIIIKNNSLWLSRWSCLGLLTREWGLPAELITARLHEFRRNTSSSTHNILILLSSPSLPPPSALALICNRAHCEGGVYVYHQIRAFSLVVSSSNQQNHYCSTGEHLWEIRL